MKKSDIVLAILFFLLAIWSFIAGGLALLDHHYSFAIIRFLVGILSYEITLKIIDKMTY